MGERLDTYRRKRDASRTPEPVPTAAGPLPRGQDDTFVIQEHHARRLHWDVRLERHGVLVSWAVPKGLPMDPRTNHLAVHTEDHPLEYAEFEGEIPRGEYGGGRVTIWDRGTYDTEKWEDDEVKVVLHGARVQGRYVFFRTRGDDWMVHRMDPPPIADWEPVPDTLAPMLATPGPLPPAAEDERWAYEMKWDGVRAVTHIEGGRARVVSRNLRDVTATYPELRALGPALGSTACVLDGEIVAVDESGRPSFGTLQRRMHVQRPTPALLRDVPVTYLLFDLLHVDGRSLLRLPYDDRRDLLEGLDPAGPNWAVPPAFAGDGAAALRTSREQGLEGIVAKRRDSPYEPGRRSRLWVKVKHVRMQEVVIGGWRSGEGARADTIGSLLLGVPGEEGLVYVGHVGTGFDRATLADLRQRLARLERQTSPFAGELPRAHARDARWVTPRLVGEAAYAERTRDGLLRHPSWRGLRPDKDPSEVVLEEEA